MPYNENILTDLPANSLLGAWCAKEFEPISSDEIDIPPLTRAATNTMTKTISKTFYDGSLQQTHTITLLFSCDYENVSVGSNGLQRYRVTVSGKTIKVPDAPNYNSSTTSYLHVDNVELRQTSIPYTAWISTTIAGKVKSTAGAGSLSASLGVSLGALSISYSIPTSFTNKGTVNINSTYTAYENYNGNYTRNISTKMNNKFSLTQIDNYFHIDSTLRDYGNARRSAQSLKTNWVVKIINGGTLDSWSYTYGQNVNISIY